MLPGRRQMTAEQRTDPANAVSEHASGSVLLLLGQLQQLLRYISPEFHSCGMTVILIKARQDKEALRAFGSLPAELASARIGLANLRRREALCGDERSSERNLKFEFPVIAIGISRQGREKFQSFPQLRNGFGHARARHRLPRGFVAVRDRLLDATGLRTMVSQQLGLCFGGAAKPFLEHPHNPAVQLLALALEQGAVGCILHERVLEQVSGVRRRTALKWPKASCTRSSPSWATLTNSS